MQVIDSPISLDELARMAGRGFGDFLKAVVDIDRGILVIDAEMHSDEEAFLLEHGSKQQHLWGINLYPDAPAGELVEFDSMINIRPSQGNRSRGVDDAETRARILVIVDSLVVA
jgi:hypothetical protein